MTISLPPDYFLKFQTMISLLVLAKSQPQIRLSVSLCKNGIEYRNTAVVKIEGKKRYRILVIILGVICHQ